MTKPAREIVLRRFGKVLAAATFLLVIAGGLVTSTDSGLSVPDWPTTYGWNMFLFPVSKWVGNIRFEHSHRLIASAVGLLTVLWTILVFRSGVRRWFKALAAAALLLVVVQGVLGGLTVKFLLPTPISVAHACLAQTFFCLTLLIALFTSRGWREPAVTPALPRRERERAVRAGEGTSLLRLSIAAFLAAYVQLLLGAWMRHSGAGLAIPDFPTAFGGVVPGHWDKQIAIHFTHRVWALVVAAVVISAAVAALRKGFEASRRSARFILALLPVQLLLGGLAIWSRRAVPVTVAHVAVGALLLGGTAWMAAEIWKSRLPAGRLDPFGPLEEDSAESLLRRAGSASR
jgi:cytochrome c oxidase assembly protein subunit 15